jgi:hypothetical protein
VGRKKTGGRKKVYRGKKGGRYVKTAKGKRYLSKGEKPPKKK